MKINISTDNFDLKRPIKLERLSKGDWFRYTLVNSTVRYLMLNDNPRTNGNFEFECVDLFDEARLFNIYRETFVIAVSELNINIK